MQTRCTEQIYNIGLTNGTRQVDDVSYMLLVYCLLLFQLTIRFSVLPESIEMSIANRTPHNIIYNTSTYGFSYSKFMCFLSYIRLIHTKLYYFV